MRLTDSSSGQLQVLGNSASVKTIESGGATVVMASGGSQGLNFAVSIIDVLQPLNVGKPDLKNIKESALNECGNIKL